MTSLEPFRRLAKLVARAFYDEEYPPKDPTRKAEKADNRGNAIVILDALTRRQWIKEEVLAQQLHLHPKQVRRTLRALQEERLVVRETRKENAKTTKKLREAVAAEAGEAAAPEEKEGDDKIKQHEFSYCALDYGQLYDVVRYRLLKAKKKIKDELEDKDTIAEYVCPNETCKRVFSALDAARLVDPITLTLQCDNCHTELVEKTNQLQLGQEGDGEASAVVAEEGEDRRTRRAKLKNMLDRMEKQLKPLTDQLAKVKDLQPPHYRTLADWEAKASATQRALAMGLETPQTAPKHQGAHATPMPFVGETKVEVNIGGGDSAGAGAGAAAAASSKPQKVIPAWVRREGMKLTAAQRGEVEPKAEAGEDVKPAVKAEPEEMDEEQQRLAEYYKAYYAALQAREETETGATAAQPTAVASGASALPAVKEEVKGEPGLEEEEEPVEWEEEASAQAEAAMQEDGDGQEDGGGGEEFEWEGDDMAADVQTDGDTQGNGTSEQGADGSSQPAGNGGGDFFGEGDDFEWDDG